MEIHRFTPAFLLALAATAGTAQAAVSHEPPAVARSIEQGHRIEAALQQGRLNASQAAALQSARKAQESRARALASARNVAAALALSHQQDRLDWAIRSGRLDAIDTP